MRPAHGNPTLVIDKRARQRVLQNIRSQRYRERQRALRLRDGVSTGEKTATNSRPITKPPPQEKPATSTKRYVPRYHRKEGPKSFWAPGLDDHTKYMMRLNGLVVGFVWKTSSDGTVYLSGTKVVRSRPAATKRPPVRMYPEDMLNKFVFKVAPKATSSDEEDAESSQVIRNPTTNARDTAANIQQNTKNTDTSNDTSNEASSEHANTRKTSPRRSPPRKPLTTARYALYRYFILRCRSMHCIYHANAKHANTAPNNAPRPTTHSTCGSVSQHSLRITRTLSSQMCRLRARLGICTTRVSSSQEEQLLDLVSDLDGEEEDTQDSDAESDDDLRLGPHAASGSRRSDPQTRRLTAGYDDNPLGAAEAQGYRKTLRVKRQRQKWREEQELWGYDESEDEASRKRSQIRARRYQYLKAAKQSKLHQEDPASPSKSAAVTNPQIISIGEDLQAVSWEVPTSIDPETSDFFLKHQAGADPEGVV